jgi:hypothetical protein
MDAKLPPPDPNEGLSGPPGLELTEPLICFALGPLSDTTERIAGAILAYRPGALFVFDTR